KKREEVSDERRVKARFGYQMLQSMKSLPGFTEDGQDVNFLRSWIAEARDLARKADREGHYRPANRPDAGFCTDRCGGRRLACETSEGRYRGMCFRRNRKGH